MYRWEVRVDTAGAMVSTASTGALPSLASIRHRPPSGEVHDTVADSLPFLPRSIRNRLTKLKKDRTEYIRAKDVLDIYSSLMGEGEIRFARCCE